MENNVHEVIPQRAWSPEELLGYLKRHVDDLEIGLVIFTRKSTNGEVHSLNFGDLKKKDALWLMEVEKNELFNGNR